MSLNATPSGERVHISFFGCTNAGKSSVVNAFLNQNISIVSDIKGTTTDPVEKAMELLPLGPVVIIDTPGIDDEGGFARAEHGELPDLTGLIVEFLPRIFVVEAHADGFDGGGFLHGFHHRGHFGQVGILAVACAMMFAHDDSSPP